MATTIIKSVRHYCYSFIPLLIFGWIGWDGLSQFVVLLYGEIYQ